jgi:hypothetical protein
MKVFEISSVALAVWVLGSLIAGMMAEDKYDITERADAAYKASRAPIEATEVPVE